MEPKTASAGVALEISFARFMASMAILNAERVLPPPFGCWDLVSMTRSGCWQQEDDVRWGFATKKEMGGRLATATHLVQTQPFEVNCIGG